MKKYFLLSSYTKRVRRVYRRYISNTAFIVAGLGRCGTTFLTECLIDSGLYPNMIFISDLSQIKSFVGGYLYKTHSYPPDALPYNVKLIYMFRNPMNIALSAFYKINEWGKIHHQHFHSDLFVPNDDILKRDTLKLESQFDAWYQPQGFDFLSIKYENLFDSDTLAMLNEYLEIHLDFKKITPSQTDYRDHPKSDELINTYSTLAKKIDEASACRFWKKK